MEEALSWLDVKLPEDSTIKSIRILPEFHS